MNRTRILAFVGLLALLLAVLGLVLHGRHKREPAFGGRTVTEWLASRDYETNRAAVSLAVVAMGEASVPALRRMLHAGTKWDRIWFAKAPRGLYRMMPVGRYQFDRKDRAMWALQTLGRDGRQAIPELLAIAQDPTEHWNQRYGAISTLRLVGAAGSVVLPVMDRLKADPVVGTFAASEVRRLRGTPEQQRYWENHKAFSASVAAQRQARTTEFQPSNSFLETGSLWEAAKFNPARLGLATNTPATLLGSLGGSATNSARGGTGGTK